MDRLPQPSSAYFETELAYTGWFADFSQKGQGIGTVEKYFSIEGEWGSTSGFPNQGRDFVDPSTSWIDDWGFDEYEVHSLGTREKPSDYNATDSPTTSWFSSDDEEIDTTSKTDDDFYWSIDVNFS
jgi:hypothetical protein